LKVRDGRPQNEHTSMLTSVAIEDWNKRLQWYRGDPDSEVLKLEGRKDSRSSGHELQPVSLGNNGGRQEAKLEPAENDD
jgi:hypothetical protein